MAQQSAAQEFREWLDSVATPVNSGAPLVDPERDYARERFDKQERYRHKWLMKNNFWYRQSVLEAQRLEGERIRAKANGVEYQEPEPLQLGEAGFWEQF